MLSLLYLNINSGCREAVRYRRLIAFVKQQNPDILALLELNGWGSNNFYRLRKFKQQTGFAYSAFCRSPHGYHMALLSRTPLKAIRKIERKMWHGAIKANISANSKRYTIIATHLSPIDEDSRLQDLDTLMDRFKTGKHTILIGDMNSLSDGDIANGPRLLKNFRRARINKFGTNRLRTDVISGILGRHFVDAVKLKVHTPGRSVPTKINIDRAHSFPIRIDYIFVSEDLKNKISSADIMKSKQTTNISDHFPINIVIA